MRPYTLPFSSLGRHDVADVGGKNSSLGEMIANLAKLGVSVPDGFATTADAYRALVRDNGLDKVIAKELQALKDAKKSLGAVGAAIRGAFHDAKLPPALAWPFADPSWSPNRATSASIASCRAMKARSTTRMSS